MNQAVEQVGEHKIVLCQSDEIVIADGQSALDFMMNIQYQTGANRFVLNKEAFDEAFFDLKTGIAGDVLQKFVNYRCKIAIYGDFTAYTSKALKDFIYESNNGNDIFFLSTKEEAVEKLSSVS